jgi:uncharacterized membrane protein
MSSSATQESTAAKLPFKLNLWHISLVLVVIGILISGYISYTELTDTSTVCIESGPLNCDAVQNSVYSTMMGIKITYLGLRPTWVCWYCCCWNRAWGSCVSMVR